MNKKSAMAVIQKAKETWPRDNPPLVGEYHKPTQSWRVVWYDRQNERHVYA